MLYREGLALQLDKGDTAIRERVIFKALSVVDSGLKLPEHDDKLLQAWFEQHRAKYDDPARFDFQEAQLAGDLRRIVREQVKAGRSDREIRAFLVHRYGEFVLLKPRFKSETLLLWLLPPLVLIGGGVALWMHGRRRARIAPETNGETSFNLTAEEEARLAQLVSAEKRETSV